MKRLLSSRPVDQALRGAALVVTDRRWAAPLSAAALGFGVFAGVAIGPGTDGSFATGAQQIIQIPSSGGDGGQGGAGGGAIASTESAAPSLGGEASGGFEEALPSTAPLVPAPVEPLPAPAGEPASPMPPSEEGGEETKKPKGQSFEGTVVDASPAAGSYAIAIKGGELVSVHAPELPQAGTTLNALLRPLANGTFVGAEEFEAGRKRATEATFRGIVSFASPDAAAPAYVVSGRGCSLLVHLEPDPSGAAPELPAVGSYVTVTARIEEPEESVESEEPKVDSTLVQSEVEVDSIPPSTYLEMAGIVKEVLPDGRLVFSADWAGESESSLTLTVPTEIDATKLAVGDSYLATAEIEADGSLTLKGIAGDEHSIGADDPAGAQGDLKR